MSINFNDDNFNTKSITNREATGLTSGSLGPQRQSGSPIETFNVTVKEASAHGSDVERSFSGPHAGVHSGAQGATHTADNFGWTSPTGNRIEIKGTSGGETIEIVHHNGAAIMIDADGAIFVMPTGIKGFGLNATRGDGVIAAANRIVVKGGAGITLETDGNLELNVGKDMHTHVAGDYTLNVHGATSLQSDGTLTLEGVKDFIEHVGGIKRTTIAGDQRTQVVGEIRYDAGKNIETRSNQSIIDNAQKSITMLAKESSSFEVDTGKLQLLSKDDISLGSQQSVFVTSTNDLTLESTQNLAVRSNQYVVVAAQQSVLIDSENYLEMRSKDSNFSATQSTDIRTGTTFVASAGTTFTTKSGTDTIVSSNSKVNLDATGAIDFRGSTIDLNKGAASPSAANPPHAPDTSAPRSPAAAGSPKSAEFPDANTILDSITSERTAPDFPHNAKKMSANEMSIHKNEGGNPNPKATAYSDGNKGAGTPPSPGQSIPSPDTPAGAAATDGVGSSGKGVGELSPYPAPSSIKNSTEKLSKFITVGNFNGLSTCTYPNGPFSQAEVLKNVMHLCHNILDPIKAKFGSQVQLNWVPTGGCGVRTFKQGGSNHYSGKAHDISATPRGNHQLTGQVAQWVVDNLPYNAVLLEKNDSGSIHIHVEAADVGSKGNKKTFTCSDPACQGKVAGLQLQFAMAALGKRA